MFIILQTKLAILQYSCLLRITKANQHTQMAKLKYNIQAHLDELPARVKISDIAAMLATYKISYDTFARDKKILATDRTSIPSDRLQVYAGLFDCSIEDLINTKKKVKPIVKKSLAKRLGINTK